LKSVSSLSTRKGFTLPSLGKKEGWGWAIPFFFPGFSCKALPFWPQKNGPPGLKQRPYFLPPFPPEKTDNHVGSLGLGPSRPGTTCALPPPTRIKVSNSRPASPYLLSRDGSHDLSLLRKEEQRGPLSSCDSVSLPKAFSPIRKCFRPEICRKRRGLFNYESRIFPPPSPTKALRLRKKTRVVP